MGITLSKSIIYGIHFPMTVERSSKPGFIWIDKASQNTYCSVGPKIGGVNQFSTARAVCLSYIHMK